MRRVAASYRKPKITICLDGPLHFFGFMIAVVSLPTEISSSRKCSASAYVFAPPNMSSTYDSSTKKKSFIDLKCFVNAAR